eukprot:sb/3467445/
MASYMVQILENVLVIIPSVGLLVNLVCLEHYWRREGRSLPSRLILLQTITDVMICGTLVASAVAHKTLDQGIVIVLESCINGQVVTNSTMDLVWKAWRSQILVEGLVNSPYRCVIMFSNQLTTTYSVTRAISLLSPFTQIKTSVVYCCLVVGGLVIVSIRLISVTSHLHLYLLPMETILDGCGGNVFDTSFIISLIEGSLILLNTIVICISTAAVCHGLRTQETLDNHRHATITIAYLSGYCVVCNIFGTSLDVTTNALFKMCYHPFDKEMCELATNPSGPQWYLVPSIQSGTLLYI